MTNTEKINMLLKKAQEINAIVDFSGLDKFFRQETEGRLSEEIYESSGDYIKRYLPSAKREAETSVLGEYLIEHLDGPKAVAGYPYMTIESWTGALWKWRYGKLVYSFDERLEDVLITQADEYEEKRLPVEVLDHMPAQSVFILCGRNDVLMKVEEKAGIPEDMRVGKGRFELLGFMITTDKAYKFKTYGTNLMIHFVMFDKAENQLMQTSSYLSLSDAKDLSIEAAVRSQSEYFKRVEPTSRYTDDEMEMMTRRNIAMAEYAMQFLLYLCAQNSEVRQAPENEKTFRKPTDKAFVKDRFREVKVMDAGYITGPRIREFIVSRNSHAGAAGDSTSRKMLPHARRAHWAHYWYGPRDAKKRDCRLRWVNTIFVNTGSGETSPVEIRVRKDKDDEGKKEK